MTIRCVLFDLDGTLVDSRADIACALDAALARHGFDRVGEDRAATFVGDGARKLVERGLTASGAPLGATDSVLASYLEEYRRCHLERTKLYSGVEETLVELAGRGVRCAVVTNKPHEFSVSLLEHLGVARYLTAVIGGDSLPYLKPRPEPLLAALEACGAEPETAAMVGDGEPDMGAGRAAGVFPVGVTYGFRDRETLEAAGALAIIDAMRELPAALDRIE
jgi:phosphoglycolate phosphatase